MQIPKAKTQSSEDSGAEISLIHHRVFKSLKQAPKLHKNSVNLQLVVVI